MKNELDISMMERRKIGGTWLKSKREAAGLSQRELAEILGLKFYNFISQIENGRSRVPVELMAPWAAALQMPLKEFARELVYYFEPLLYEALFGEMRDGSSL